MFGLPQNTVIKKQLPKKAIYAKFELKQAQKDSFDADISRIDIVGVVSPVTVPAIAVGESIKEFYVLTVQLKKKRYEEKNIAMLSKLIPQNIVFALQYEDETQLAIYYHTKLIKSAWKQNVEVVIPLSGLNLDTVWENIVKDIGNILVEEGNTLTKQIEDDNEQIKIRTQILSLQRQLEKEKQFNKQIEINSKIKVLKKQLK